MTASPQVSIVIPAHNASRTLRACLASVRRAEYEAKREVIVVDDASTDDTAAIASQMGCRVIHRSTNGGPARARNAGARAARGEILIFVDADTQMRQDTIREAVRALSREGVGAVTGIYEVEPINPGFFQTYYAYLKFHAFTSNDADRMTAFGGQCGAIYKELFDAVGGYRSIPWRVDVENEELGYRLNQRTIVAIGRRFRVRHNFPGLRKLMFIFTTRVYWWVRFSRYARKDESVLMTRGFGASTAAFPAAGLSLLGALVAPAGPCSALLNATAIALGVGFVWGYKGFWGLCLRRRGLRFAFAAALASAFFALIITVSAAQGYLASVWSSLSRRELPFVRAATGQV